MKYNPLFSFPLFLIILGSVFLESENDRLIHEGFRQILAAANLQTKENDFGLNGTRIDFDTQYAQENDLFDAHQKVCMEMQYKYV